MLFFGWGMQSSGVDFFGCFFSVRPIFLFVSRVYDEIVCFLDASGTKKLEKLLLPLSFSARGERDNVQLLCSTGLLLYPRSFETVLFFVLYCLVAPYCITAHHTAMIYEFV